ncbi:MAG: hypothetical protein WC303_02405 [Candidatus Paceibacterota bacterium]|jgi:hypothetical protein
MTLIDQINNYLSSPELSSFLLPFKIVMILTSVIFFVYIVYYAINQIYMIGEKRRNFKNFFANQDFNYQEYIFNRWKVVEEAASKDDDINTRLAILSLEGMLFDMFKAMKYEGHDLKELLPQVIEKREFGNPETLEAITYLSDKIKSDPSYKVSPDIVKKIVEDIKIILNKLKII